VHLTDFKLSRAVPAAIAALITVNIAALGFAELQISQLAKSSQELAEFTRQNDGSIKELEVLAKGMELDIVSTQEALTDISATRGLDGLDDGFVLAEESAAALAGKANRVSEIGDRLGEPALRAAMVSLAEKFAVFHAAGIEMAQAYVAGGPAEGNRLMQSFDQVAVALEREVEASIETIHAAEARIDAQIKAGMDQKLAEAEKSLYVGLAFAGLALVFGLMLMLYIVRNVVRPLVSMKEYMGMLATGDYSKDVPHADRKDEIGEMAQSVAYFRQGEIERKSARERSEAEQAEIHRLEQEAAERKAVEDAERVRVIEALTQGLENLSAGNLTYRINEAFAPDYEKLRTEFNSSVDRLNSTVQDIAATTEAVRLSSSEIGSAADDLSKRTEQQAASLEETAAALDEITSTVKSSSQRAEEASEMVAGTKDSTEKSAKVVQTAISAMEKIEESSGRISQIISVIDDIAFQTNLLALNAGVEAARAGEAGKEIKTLIETSSTHVGNGVSLVNQTGTALAEIESQVIKINDHIRSIVTGAREQSTALAEINSAVNQMDQVTQQNAAMVEQTNAATQGLSGEAVKLEGLVGSFKTGASGSHRSASGPTPASAASRPAQSPARALGAKIASVFGGGSAAASKQESWSEF